MDLEPQYILSDLIKIDSSNPPGRETAVAGYLEDLFQKAGIKGDIIEPEPGRGSFIARIGSGKKRLLYISHSDVVPAGDDWDFSPFSGEIKDGIVYGRGALDCKDLMAAQVAAAMQLVEENFDFKGELIIAAVADEEKGGTLGAGYLVKNSPEKLMADFAVNEGAERPVPLNGRMLYFIQTGEKGIAWCTLKAKGISGHGAVPFLADNAVVKMARAVGKLYEYQPRVLLIPEVETLFRKLASLSGIPAASAGSERIDIILDSLPLNKAFVESLRAMTRMTVSPNIINGGTKTNIVPDYCEASIDIRILPGQDIDYVKSELRSVIGTDIEIKIQEYQESTFSSSGEPYYCLMKEVTEELTGPKTLCLPAISAGSTDSKYLRSLGIPSYGIGHMDRDFDQQIRTTVHGRNERSDIRSLHLKTAFLKELARRYLG